MTPTVTTSQAPTVGSVIYSPKTGETATVTRVQPTRGGALVHYETIEGRESNYHTAGANVLAWTVLELHDERLTGDFARILDEAMREQAALDAR